MEIKKVYVLENGHLTINQVTEELACIEDLEAWSCVSTNRFEGYTLETSDGLFRWYAHEFSNEWGDEDFECGYECVVA